MITSASEICKFEMFNYNFISADSPSEILGKSPISAVQSPNIWSWVAWYNVSCSQGRRDGVIYVSVSGREMVWMMKYGDWRWLKLTGARGHSWGRTL